MSTITEAQKVVIALKIAKDLNLNHYTSLAFARDASGNEVDAVFNRQACSWCAYGAVGYASAYVGVISGRAQEFLRHAACDAGSSVAELNDFERERLPELWGRAIALAESEAQ